MIISSTTLFYIHDPMCSWCWGFRPVWQQLESQLKNTIDIVYIVGGLAADSNSPMPKAMQASLASTWHQIERHIAGAKFNHAFWKADSNTFPRRSTYPACRAILAAKAQNSALEQAMIHGVQKAYYLHAKNPSNTDTLISVAQDIGLNPKRFAYDLISSDIEHQLQQQIQLARSLSSQGFPSLVLKNETGTHGTKLDYNDSQPMLQAINKLV